jgi:hypothetical protein
MSSTTIALPVNESAAMMPRATVSQSGGPETDIKKLSKSDDEFKWDVLFGKWFGSSVTSFLAIAAMPRSS